MSRAITPFHNSDRFITRIGEFRKMYIPLNTDVYLAAYLGAYGSMTASMRIPTSQLAATYDNAAKSAGAWAQSFDVAWAGKASSDLQLTAISDASEATWDGRTPPNAANSFLPATYTAQILALIASISAASSYYAANVTPGEQNDYYVNGITGNDSNSGANPLVPLKTINALNSRLSNKSPTNPVIVRLETDFPPSDPLFLNNFQGTLKFIGTRKTIRLGTITGFTAVNRPTNTATNIVDAAVLDWTPDLALTTGRRLRITGGANGGMIVYVAENVGGGAANTDVPYDSGLNEGMLVPGDPYAIEELTKLTIQTLSLDGQVSSFPFGTLTFDDVRIEGILFAAGGSGGANVTYKTCHFDALPAVTSNWDISFYKCCGSQGVFSLGGNSRVYSGLWGPNVFDGSCIIAAGAGGLVTIDFDATAWGGAIALENGGIAVGVAAAFNAPVTNGLGAGVRIGAGTVQVENLPSGSFGLYPFNLPTTALYGKGHAEWGIAIGSGSVMTWRQSLPTITGTLGDFKLSEGARERAFDEAAGAYTPVVAPTWVNMATPVGGGGFGGSAHDVTGESHLLKADF
jgi:hypothetical protein